MDPNQPPNQPLAQLMHSWYLFFVDRPHLLHGPPLGVGGETSQVKNYVATAMARCLNNASKELNSNRKSSHQG